MEPNRQKTLHLVTFFSFVLFILLNSGSWYLYYKSGDVLEKELGSRLESIAVTAAAYVKQKDIDILINKSQSDVDYLLLDRQLMKIKNMNELECLFIFDKDYVGLYDTRTNFTKGTVYPYVKSDSAAIGDLLKQGISGVSELHKIEGEVFKTGYAPLKKPEEQVAAILAVEASADFLAELKQFRNSLYLLAVLSFAALFLITSLIRRAIRSLIKAEEALMKAEKFAGIGRMAAGIAHEIRNPLGIIKSSSDLLKKKYLAEKDAGGLVEFIGDEVKRIDVLVRQFLSLAKEEKLELAETDLKELTLKTVRSLSQDEKFRGIEPTITVITENVKCLCDSSKIEQVMLNLLLNARDAVKSGGEVEIILDSFYNKGKRIVKVSVKDTGMGMDEDTLSKVFEPFYTKFEGGTGLGLAICRKIIEDHCGQIEVRSEPGKGSVFTFKLPCN